jgi:predicted outer membrane protein
MTPDPDREKVERADAVVRQSEEAVMDDPTVFVKGAALAGLTLIALAKLAKERSQAADVQGFATGLQAHQEALRKDLLAVAGRKKLDVPGALVFTDEQMLEGAPEVAGEFDGWFALHVHAELLKAIALFEPASKMKDAQLAALARRSLPGLEADRKLAAALAR